MNLTDIDRLNFTTLGGLMEFAVREYSDRPLWGIKKDGVYEWMSYSEFDVIMRKFRSVLKKSGFVKGDRLAVIANNSVEFAAAVYAAYGLGGIVVPMYEVQKLQDWEYIFGDSKPKIAVVGTDVIREKIEGLGCESLEKIYVIRPEKGSTSEALMKCIEEETELCDVDASVSETDISDIIYTSGTTGRPRGVELTHRGIVKDCKGTAARFSIGPSDRTLAFLPWAHAFGKTVELHIFPSVGASIGLVESNRTISQNLVEVNPTILVSVPKIFNKIYDTVHLMMEEKRSVRVLFEQAQALSRKAQSGKLSLFGKAQKFVLDKTITAKVRSRFGTSLRFCISGGASLSQEVMTFFGNFGIRIYEGYGMTEHSPIISVNNPELCKVGAVGRPLDGVKIEILHDNENLDKSDERCGEIVITSESIMKGYHGAPEATLEMIDSQGRLRTGDMGYVDEDGCLWITGRVKEQYKLENGKYVVPTALEEKINDSTMISNAVVFGAGRPYNVVLLHPSDEFVAKFRKEHHLEEATQESLETNSELRELLNQELQSRCNDFRGYERPQKFAVTLEEFTIENGLLTPALKIKRREVEKRFGEVLSGLYRT